MFKRATYDILLQRLHEKRRFIQVISGPRQVGKTTLVQQVLAEIDQPHHFSTAEESINNQSIWIEQQWEAVRLQMRRRPESSFILVIDEIQKIKDWSSVVKLHWDQDSRNGLDIKLVLLGSSRLLLEEGLTESLAGRFERLVMTHWSFSEMRDAFGFSAEEYVWFGGYPGAASLKEDELRWADYIRNALVETTISKDILQLNRIHKPALLKRLFEFSCTYSGRILSYTKMLGQLVDAGNTTTLSHYLKLLSSAGLVMGLEKYSGSLVRTRSSSPKLQVLNTAFFSVYQASTFDQTLSDAAQWGHHIESTVGAHLGNATFSSELELFYWRHRNEEVDFVIKKGHQIIGIEVKSTTPKKRHQGINSFKAKYAPHKVLLVGSSGLSWKEFLLIDPNDLF